MSEMDERSRKHYEEHQELHATFGETSFGALAEKIARLFGTPRYIVGQSIMVAAWVAVNGLAFTLKWDPYPFILLNLAFSLQAAYAAPLILLAQTRQAARDKAHEEAAAAHRDEIATSQRKMLEENTRLTERVAELSQRIDKLTQSIHERVVGEAAPPR